MLGYARLFISLLCCSTDKHCCDCSVAAAALLPGNSGLWGLQPVDTSATGGFEIIDTANSRWMEVPNQFFFNGAYTNYKCDIGCVIPYYVYSIPRSASNEWGYAPAVPAALPFPAGNSLGVCHQCLAQQQAAASAFTVLITHKNAPEEHRYIIN